MSEENDTTTTTAAEEQKPRFATPELEGRFKAAIARWQTNAELVITLLKCALKNLQNLQKQGDNPDAQISCIGTFIVLSKGPVEAIVEECTKAIEALDPDIEKKVKEAFGVDLKSQD